MHRIVLALALTACAPEIRFVQAEPSPPAPPAPPPDPGPPRILYTGRDLRAPALCRASVIDALRRRGIKSELDGMPAVIRIIVLSPPGDEGWSSPGWPRYPDRIRYVADLEADVGPPGRSRHVVASGFGYAVEAVACSAASERFANAVADALGLPSPAPITPGPPIRVIPLGP